MYPSGEKLPNQDVQDDIHKFFLELVDLCNKYRVSISIKRIFGLHKVAHDGKLLDVAGFSYDEENQITNPVYIDTLS